MYSSGRLLTVFNVDMMIMMKRRTDETIFHVPSYQAQAERGSTAECTGKLLFKAKLPVMLKAELKAELKAKRCRAENSCHGNTDMTVTLATFEKRVQFNNPSNNSSILKI